MFLMELRVSAAVAQIAAPEPLVTRETASKLATLTFQYLDMAMTTSDDDSVSMDFEPVGVPATV